MKQEIWKDVCGYEGLYQVSNIGNVRSLNYRVVRGRINELSRGLSKTGYYVVVLCRDKKQTTVHVHRLVAEAFIDNPDNKPVVNHKDENKTNCSVDNLEWVTQKENVNLGTSLERRTIKRKGLKLPSVSRKLIGNKNAKGHKLSSEAKEKISNSLKNYYKVRKED